MEEQLHYKVMVDKALRSVVFDALKSLVEIRRLPGKHHFYIQFLTTFPGVIIPAHLLKKHPTEMVIVLQKQFHGFVLHDDSFGVTLSFDDTPQHLTVPLAAITIFADPSVDFSLQFEKEWMLAELAKERGGQEKLSAEAKPNSQKGVIVSFENYRTKGADEQDN